MSDHLAAGFAVHRPLASGRAGAQAAPQSADGLPRWQLISLALVGSVAASVVGYLVSRNPDAAPAHVAVGLRVLLIVILMAVGIYGLAGANRSRMGAVLVGARVLEQVGQDVGLVGGVVGQERRRQEAVVVGAATIAEDRSQRLL